MTGPGHQQIQCFDTAPVDSQVEVGDIEGWTGLCVCAVRVQQLLFEVSVDTRPSISS